MLRLTCTDLTDTRLVLHLSNVRLAHNLSNVRLLLTSPRPLRAHAQENPRAAQAHLKDPSIQFKLNKLVAAGIVQVK